MGRTAKHNWPNLYLEYCQGRYKNVADFARAKGIHPVAVRRAFNQLKSVPPEDMAAQQNTTEKGNRTKQKRPAADPTAKQKIAPDHNLKKQFTDWPEDRRRTYVVQLEARKAELEAVPPEEITPAEMKELGRVRRERRAILSDPDPDVKCRAHARDGSPCRNQVERGKRTCWIHGGAPGSGGPNNLKHGAYETIWLDQLDEEERELAERVVQDKLKALEEEIILLTIRERRMLARIARLTGEDLTVVKIRYEKGVGPLGLVDKTDTESQATLGQIQQIEQELTKVQDKKLKAIELRHKEERLRIEREHMEQSIDIRKQELQLRKQESEFKAW